MSFPTTGILDNFNRADESPLTSAMWSTTPAQTLTTNKLKVVSNECQPIAATGVSQYWMPLIRARF